MTAIAAALAVALTACSGGPQDEPLSGPPRDQLDGAVVLYSPPGCGMCPDDYRPATYRFYADGRVAIDGGSSSQVVSATGVLPPETVRDIERRTRALGLDAGDARRWYPKHTADLGEATVQTRLDGKTTTRIYARTDGYRLIGFGDWLAATATSAR